MKSAGGERRRPSCSSRGSARAPARAARTTMPPPRTTATAGRSTRCGGRSSPGSRAPCTWITRGPRCTRSGSSESAWTSSGVGSSRTRTARAAARGRSAGAAEASSGSGAPSSPCSTRRRRTTSASSPPGRRLGSKRSEKPSDGTREAPSCTLRTTTTAWSASGTTHWSAGRAPWRPPAWPSAAVKGMLASTCKLSPSRGDPPRLPERAAEAAAVAALASSPFQVRRAPFPPLRQPKPLDSRSPPANSLLSC